MRDHSKRFTHREWKEDYVDRVIQLGEDCDKEIELEPAVDEDFRWAKEDVRNIVNALVEICSDNASDLGMALLIDGWTDCPITPESVGAELFNDPRMFPADATEDYLREFVRGVLIG